VGGSASPPDVRPATAPRREAIITGPRAVTGGRVARVIRFDRVSVTYDGASAPALREVDLHVAEGELCLLVGPTGAGKSTLLRAVNGLVPHFSGGRLAGRVTVAGRDTRTHPPRELADVVGMVLQDPAAGFVTDAVEDELAYGMESLGLPPTVMRRRVEDTLDVLGLAELRGRALRTLSGGQQQRVAIGAVLTAHPRVLVLDEPTSALDPPAAEEVLATLQRLVHDLGLTVLLAEHRLERVVQYADRVAYLPGPGEPLRVGAPGEVLEHSSVVPPVVALARLAGWSPPPLTVRDARRVAGPLRQTLTDGAGSHDAAPSVASTPSPHVPRSPAAPHVRRSPAPPVLDVRGLVAGYGGEPVLRGLDLRAGSGEVIALMGRNGAGKSTLLAALVGLIEPRSGRAEVAGRVQRGRRARDVVRDVGLVPQTAADLLYADTVAEECAAADAEAGAARGTTAALLARIVPEAGAQAHPRDLSEGQRLALALSVVLAGSPPLVLLDEPTRGLDYPAKARLVAIVGELARSGSTVVLATHDVELAAEVATRTVVLADGEIVADDDTSTVLTSSPAFAPQVAKVLAPLPVLTVREVAQRLATVGAVR